MPAESAPLSAEFQSLAVIRTSLRASIAAREKQPATSPDFRAVTGREKSSLLEVEARMKQLDASAFTALEKTEKTPAPSAEPAQ